MHTLLYTSSLLDNTTCNVTFGNFIPTYLILSYSQFARANIYDLRQSSTNLYIHLISSEEVEEAFNKFTSGSPAQCQESQSGNITSLGSHLFDWLRLSIAFNNKIPAANDKWCRYPPSSASYFPSAVELSYKY